jgi:hypothetical protein
MPTRFACLAVPLAALGCAAIAPAQVTKPLNLSIRAGIFTPSSSVARDAGKSWFAIGAEARIKDIGVSMTNPGHSSYLTVSVDSFSKGGFRSIPILANYVYRTDELYFTGGAGVALVEEPGGDDETRFGYQIGAGWDFARGATPFFVEAKWFGTSGNDRLNGFGFYVGVRL